MDDKMFSSPAPPLPPLLNLTFNQIQTQFPNSGKPLTSMNLDEFLKNLIPIEYRGNFNFNEELSERTIDEIWKQIASVTNHHITLGETTLEDFFIFSGVINGGNQINVVPTVEITPVPDLMQFQQLGTDFNVSESVFGNYEMGLSENQMGISNLGTLGRSLSVPVAGERKRLLTDEIMAKGNERRLKRKIKNRESAARSRARKQAYTNTLEHQVSQLQANNEWLQKEMKTIRPKQKYGLRRTSSSPF